MCSSMSSGTSMIIAIRIPHFWIVVEELRCPELHDRPIIIGEGFLEKTGGQARVLASNHLAAEFGVKPGVSLAHARQLCPEAVFISPDMPVYAGVWGEVMALLLTYTPVVQSVTPGEALCDVTGCERLFGDPLTLAGDLVRHIQGSLSLPAFAGVATNRLVAQLAARDTTAPTRFIPSGHEAAFLAPLPITVLPDLDAQLLLDFQVLGVKTVEHLSRISERAMAKRFGPVGARLARYARGVDDRPVQPDPRLPSVAVSRRTDDDLFDGLDVDGVARHLVQLLAGDLVAALHEQRLAGRLLRLVIREPRDEPRLPN